MTWDSSFKFLIVVVLGYVVVIQALSALLARKKNIIPLGYIPTLHNLFLAVGLAIMFLGCLQATVVEVEWSNWLWGGPKHNIDWVLCFLMGNEVHVFCFLVLCVLLERVLWAFSTHSSWSSRKDRSFFYMCSIMPWSLSCAIYGYNLCNYFWSSLFSPISSCMWSCTPYTSFVASTIFLLGRKWSPISRLYSSSSILLFLLPFYGYISRGRRMVEDDWVCMFDFSMISSTSLYYSFSTISIASNMEQKVEVVGATTSVISKHDSTLLHPTFLLCMDGLVMDAMK